MKKCEEGLIKSRFSLREKAVTALFQRTSFTDLLFRNPVVSRPYLFSFFWLPKQVFSLNNSSEKARDCYFCFKLNDRSDLMNFILDRIIHLDLKKESKNTWIFHVVFWLCFLCIIIFFSDREESIGFKIVNSLIHTISYITIIYINIYVLIPRYLTEKTVYYYLGWLIGLVFIVTSIKIGTQYVISSEDLYFRLQLVKEQPLSYLSSFILAGGSTAYTIISYWINQQKKNKELETQTMQSEINFLKTQINPHFLFNTLNALYALTLKKSDIAPEVVLKLSEMMRYMLYECNEKYVSLPQELTYLQNYLDLERIRHTGKVDIRMEVKGDTEHIMIAPLILITFIENAFKHGLKNRIEGGFVHIFFEVTDDRLQFRIINSKADIIGPASTHNKKNSGIGLINVTRRLHLVYPVAHELKISNNPDTFEVTLTINTQNYISNT